VVQAQAVKYFYPQLEWVGSSLMFRTGLDGDTAFVGNHLSILTNRGRLGDWWFLFVAGILSILGLMALFLRDRSVLPQVIIVGTALGACIPTVFVFSQSAAIHPHYYNVLFAAPLVVALFGFLPGELERVT